MFEIRRSFSIFRLTAFGWTDGSPSKLPSWEFERLAEYCGWQMPLFPDL